MTALVGGRAGLRDLLGMLVFAIAWGLVGGGLLEELGWTRFAVPALRQRHGVLQTGLIVPRVRARSPRTGMPRAPTVSHTPMKRMGTPRSPQTDWAPRKSTLKGSSGPRTVSR
jgi:hypothetical protein